MIINVASSHRFHLLDLARELARQGNDVRFYSYVPAKRCEEYGLPKGCAKSFTWLVLLFFGVQKLIGERAWLTRLRNYLIDWYVSKTMLPCDVFIGLGSVYLSSFKKAKEKYGAKTILEWGSKHVIEQNRVFGILDKYPKKDLNRELTQYKIADYIAIAADHVKQSFLIHGVPENKLFVNPYGVALEQFHPTELNGDYDIIYVGGWRYRKGSDKLIELCKRYGYKLLHVGAIVNLPFPTEGNFTHIDPVDQRQLVKYYAQAKVFVIPSLSEGLAMVQAQAIVCGLPLVCSKDTGGRDLKQFLAHPEYIIEMPDLSIETMHKCVEKALALAGKQLGVRNYAGDISKSLTWEAYGKRYNDFLKSLF